MKSRFKLLLCVVLLLAMCTSLICLSAAADYTYYLSTKDHCRDMIVFQFFRDIEDANFDLASGSFAPGLTYDYDDTFIYVDGVPNKPGTYTLSGRASTEDGNGEEYSFTIIVQSDTDTEIPVETDQPMLAPKLTKSPTDESVYEGSSAVFIARADEADRIEWYLVEPETHSSYTLAQAASQLKGLSFSGQGSERLELYNIPLEMNDWQVECLFTNAFGSVISDPATIYVDELKLVSPTIKTQPQSADKQPGEAVILSVIADNKTEGSKLMYQWYMSATGSGNLNAISGANSSSYTPPKTEGTVYYTVAVWSSIDGKDSGKTYSSPAAVTYQKAQTSPSPAPRPSAKPSPSPSMQPVPSTVPNIKDKDEGGFGLLAILFVALVLSAALAVFILVILRKNAKAAAVPTAENVKPRSFASLFEKEEDSIEEEILEPIQPQPQRLPKEWQCSCGALNNSSFCTQCGRARPVIKPCAKCGWTPESANNIPHFCPECGSPFDEE